MKAVLHEYLEAAHAAGFRQVRIVHGKGIGVQRDIVQAALDRHPLVVEFWDEWHLGATGARLRDDTGS